MTLTRRRFLTLASAACLVSPARQAQAFRHTGMALGARVQILLDHPDAERIAAGALAEITRLEGIFSLYREGSDLVRLNRQGVLEVPSFELLDCLSVARHAHRVTGGRFDPTVQKLWQALAEGHAGGGMPDPDRVAAARALVGFDRVRFDTRRITLGRGQALTLNGIAQGYIADRVADRMRAAGVADVLIDTGEIIAMGDGPGRQGWPVRLQGATAPRHWRNRALATSAVLGTVLDAGGRQGHILSPDAAAPPRAVRVSVSARHAALADALSTGLCLADLAEAHRIAGTVTGVRLEAHGTDNGDPATG